MDFGLQMERDQSPIKIARTHPTGDVAPKEPTENPDSEKGCELLLQAALVRV